MRTLNAVLLAAFVSPAFAQSTKSIEARLEILENRVRDLQGRVPWRGASLDCATKKYEEFTPAASYLPLMAACLKIEPYLEGHQVTIHVGNPHSFTFSDISGALNYGKDYVDSILRSVPVATSEPFRAGSWTLITVVVNPSRPEQMRHLELSLEIKSARSTAGVISPR